MKRLRPYSDLQRGERQPDDWEAVVDGTTLSFPTPRSVQISEIWRDERRYSRRPPAWLEKYVGDTVLANCWDTNCPNRNTHRPSCLCS